MTRDPHYLTPEQLEHFRQRLLAMRQDVLEDGEDTLQTLRAEKPPEVPDPADQAAVEIDHTVELSLHERQRHLLRDIEEALRRLDEGTYGYCEETGEPIGLQRLEARPTATLSLEAQELREHRERHQGGSR
jgi:DnaK suppressor protein